MADRGTLEQAVRIFLEESYAFALGPLTAVGAKGWDELLDAEKQALLGQHRQFIHRTDLRMRAVGWTLREYQDMPASPEQFKVFEQVHQELSQKPEFAPLFNRGRTCGKCAVQKDGKCWEIALSSYGKDAPSDRRGCQYWKE